MALFQWDSADAAERMMTCEGLRVRERTGLLIFTIRHSFSRTRVFLEAAMTRSIGAWSFGLLWLCLQPRFAVAEPPPTPQFLQADTISRIVEQVEPSVVSILRVRHRPEESRLKDRKSVV